jgi:hypothetical protein
LEHPVEQLVPQDLEHCVEHPTPHALEQLE